MTFDGEEFEVSPSELDRRLEECEEERRRIEQRNLRATEAVHKARDSWLTSCELRERQYPERLVGPKRAELSYDSFTLDGVPRKCAAGHGRAYLEKVAEEKFPDAVMEKVPARPKSRVAYGVYWKANLIQDGESQELAWPFLTMDHGAPLQWITQVLNEYEQQGWSLVQVTEDHGLYRREDGLNEAYLNRIRYLLHRAP